MNFHATVPVVKSFQAPLIVFGGPYSNLEATRALLAEADRLGVPPANIICTGDLVAYGADAAATVDTIRSAGIHVIMGNCEESLAASSEDCGCGFIPGSTCERLSAAWFQHADRTVGEESRRWMASLPRQLMVEIGDRRLMAVHGSVPRINEFIFASTLPEIKENNLDLANTDGIIAGHCGLPFSELIGNRLWHNAGAIGMPANDGTPKVWFSLLRPETGGIRIEHRSLQYDFEAAAGKMRSSGLPEEYASALESGLWPNCDMLPYREILERGLALKPREVFWPTVSSIGSGPHIRRKKKSEPLRLWPELRRDNRSRLQVEKFQNVRVTASGEDRASVPLRRLDTLWVNTGTLCNITCKHCYIESSPKNDRLAYIRCDEVRGYLDEIRDNGLGTEEIGFTGGEPFMNPEIMSMLDTALQRGFRVLILSNAMKPMQRFKQPLKELNAGYRNKLSLRISLDHYTSERHEEERGLGTFKPALEGLSWLSQNGFQISVAGRTMWNENEASERAGYGRLFEKHNIRIDPFDPAGLVLFPEMDETVDVPEITSGCWTILGKSPADVMCSSARMVVKRKGADRPAVVACTLIPYDPRFELGTTLNQADAPVYLNHPHCARFCVLGGASCSQKSSAQKRNDAKPEEAAKREKV
jgi:sulfatase maturation enzyme AslB (radical SAM superfamily)/predicted phosphodiesterase